MLLNNSNKVKQKHTPKKKQVKNSVNETSKLLSEISLESILRDQLVRLKEILLSYQVTKKEGEERERDSINLYGHIHERAKEYVTDTLKMTSSLSLSLTSPSITSYAFLSHQLVNEIQSTLLSHSYLRQIEELRGHLARAENEREREREKMCTELIAQQTRVMNLERERERLRVQVNEREREMKAVRSVHEQGMKREREIKDCYMELHDHFRYFRSEVLYRSNSLITCIQNHFGFLPLAIKRQIQIVREIEKEAIIPLPLNLDPNLSLSLSTPVISPSLPFPSSDLPSLSLPLSPSLSFPLSLSLSEYDKTFLSSSPLTSSKHHTEREIKKGNEKELE
mmetsp:Transcript_15431/g.15555  ORF Transcript_15431/g.15555 Transcript_15431/m.15555 type:complete len:338 (+) Transcript_15431:245-1258(+)